MPRPKYCRKIICEPAAKCFKPDGINQPETMEVVITLDEFEALRLADYEGLYQGKSAEMMNISRQTFGRIIDSARKKIADALIHGKILKIEGGVVSLEENGGINCSSCDNITSCCRKNEIITACPRCRKMYNLKIEGESVYENSTTNKKQHD